MSSIHGTKLNTIIQSFTKRHSRTPKTRRSRVSQRLPTFSERQQKRIERGQEPQKYDPTKNIRQRHTSMNMHPLIMTGNQLGAKFNLRFVKKITVGVCYYMPWSVNHGVVSFYIACLKERQRATKIQEAFTVPIEMDFLPDYSNPKIHIEYEDGREIKFDDASFLTPQNIQELMFIKKQKIKRHKRLMGESVYDSEEEEPGEKLFPTEQA